MVEVPGTVPLLEIRSSLVKQASFNRVCSLIRFTASFNCFQWVAGRIIIEGLLERNVGHIYATDCNENQVQLTQHMFNDKVLYRVFENLQTFADPLSNRSDCKMFLFPNVNIVPLLALGLNTRLSFLGEQKT